MKKIVIIVVSIFLLIASFAFGFFIKKSIDDKKFYNLKIKKNDLEEKINQLEEINFKLSGSANFRNPDDEKKLEKLTEDIYFDKNSLTKDKQSVNAWFKVYNSENTDTTSSYVGADFVYYELTKFSTACESNILCRIYIKEFDKDGNVLTDEFDGYNHCGNYSEFRNGKIYYNTLCRYKK